MIRKIESINNLGIFSNFSWNSIPNLEEFKEKNIIYAWNYSGKTTLSRLFSSLKEKALHPDYPLATFKITCDSGIIDNSNMSTNSRHIEVFNSDYIKDNLRWGFDEEISGISFEVGDTAKISQRVEELNKLIDEINGTDKIKGKREPYVLAINDYNEFENFAFTDEARRIKNDVFWSLIEFTKAHLKRIKNDISNDSEKHIIKSKKELENLGEIVLVKEPKEKLNPIFFPTHYREIVLSAKEILIFVPSKSEIGNILKNNNEVYEWSKEGLKLHLKGDKCSFCGNIITENRYNDLINYFQSQASELKEKAKEVLGAILSEINFLKSEIIPYSSNDFNDSFQEEFKKLKSEFDKELKKYVVKVNQIKSAISKKKEKSMYEVINIQNEENDIIPIVDKINEINTLIDSNNDFSDNFKTIIDEKRTVYKNHLVATFLKNTRYFFKEREEQKAQKELKILDEKVTEYQKEIVQQNLRRESKSEGCAQFNSFVQSFLGRSDIEIQPSKESGKYNLIRGANLAKNLSEGEKTAISFSHFLVLLKSIEKKGELKDCIIFIDDPISSLDSNHVFQINSLLKDVFFEQIPDPKQSNQLMWNLKCKQLFISTHNFEFFNLLKEMPKSKGLGKNKESRYFISRKLQKSTIEKLPKVYDSYSSEYQYLFSKIVEFDKEPNQGTSEVLFIIPNILRRFVEMYTLTKYPSSDEVDIRADEVFGKEVSKRILKPLHYFSHFNNIDRIGKQSEFIADIGSACKELLKHLKKDKTHYKALQSVI